MLMLMATWEPPAPAPPPEDAPQRDEWTKHVWIVLAIMAGLYVAVLFLLLLSFFRGHLGNLHFAGVTPLLAFPSDLALTIRRRVYRRLGHRLTAEERRRVYLLEMGKLDRYEQDGSEGAL